MTLRRKIWKKVRFGILVVLSLMVPGVAFIAPSIVHDWSGEND
jgi:hypothetical protein